MQRLPGGGGSGGGGKRHDHHDTDVPQEANALQRPSQRPGGEFATSQRGAVVTMPDASCWGQSADGFRCMAPHMTLSALKMSYEVTSAEHVTIATSCALDAFHRPSLTR